jgi:hypothetical protein
LVLPDILVLYFVGWTAKNKTSTLKFGSPRFENKEG